MRHLRCNLISAHVDRGWRRSNFLPPFTLQHLFSFFFLSFLELYTISSSSFSCPSEQLLFINAHFQSFNTDTSMSLDTPSAGADIYADQRGRIIGSYTATISLTFVFVFLRLLSRKLSGAGYWVSLG